MWVGFPTYRTILGNKVAPGFADRYLARTGWSSQMTAEPVDPDRPSSLFEPVDDDVDYSAHGEFDERARDSSWMLWVTSGAFIGTGTMHANPPWDI